MPPLRGFWDGLDNHPGVETPGYRQSVATRLVVPFVRCQKRTNAK